MTDLETERTANELVINTKKLNGNTLEDYLEISIYKTWSL